MWYVNVRPNQSLVLPLLVIGICGATGVAVDFFDIYKAIRGGPKWLNQLDVLVAITFTVIIGSVDTYYRRRD